MNDLPNDENKRFVFDYRKKHPDLRPSAYGAQAYDAAARQKLKALSLELAGLKTASAK